MELLPQQVRKTIDPKSVGVENTGCLKPTQNIIGQKRAISALEFGLNIEENGFNVYVAGPQGIGKRTAVKSFLETLASGKKAPADWCYVNNFDDPYQPKALKLPHGYGKKLQQDVEDLIDHIKREMPKSFESDDYTNKREKVMKEMDRQKNEIIQRATEKASQAGFSLEMTRVGIVIVPVRDDRPINDTEFQTLPASMKEDILRKREGVQEELNRSMKEMRQLERNAQKKLQELDRRIVHYMVDGLIEDLCENYSEIHEVVDYLRAVREDILKNVGLFRPDRSPVEKAPWLQELPFRKYQVNVLVDNSQLKNAPVVVEHNPTYNNLLGTIEKEAQFGALYTDLTMIKAGSLYKANGGYLVIPAEGILRNPYSWEALKRAVRSNKIEIEEQRLGFVATKSLKPQPIPLNVKVVLIGSPRMYYALYYYDDDFRELFKVKAEFDTHMKYNKENAQDFLSFICTFCDKEGLKHLDSTAASKLMEYSSRLAEDQEKLSTQFGALADLIREANFWAMKEGIKYVKEAHVKKALEEKVYRSNLVQEHIQEAITGGTLLIDTDGKKVGQTNGLSVASLGDYTFGRPSRITASVGAGREGIVDIEREVKLGGPIHSKGVLILNGYLLKKYAWDKPLTLEARLVFEQSYGGIEGDSASSTELYTVLSALSDLPIKQGIAVTGSVNQNGEVQAIGGVNEKIEGFFDVCKTKKLTGEQGVIIPESNVKNLMLREDIVEAVNQKKFRIWSVKTIDEGIEILTGVPAGARGKDNKFPEGTVNYLVDKRLKEFTKSLKKISEKEKKAKKKE